MRCALPARGYQIIGGADARVRPIPQSVFLNGLEPYPVMYYQLNADAKIPLMVDVSIRQHVAERAYRLRRRSCVAPRVGRSPTEAPSKSPATHRNTAYTVRV